MSKQGHSLQIVLLPLAAALIFLCIALLTSQLIRDVTLAPLQRDEAEFLHTAWLMYGGSAIYKDFFQHHSPLFFVILSKAVSNGSDLGWVYAIRLIHFAGIALVIGLVFSLITAAQPKASNRPGYSLSIGLLLVFTLWAVKPMATFQIRPELWALVSWLLAWRLIIFPDGKSSPPCPSPCSGGSNKTNGGKSLTPADAPTNTGKPPHGIHGAIAGRMALFVACLLLGAAAAFTPRSIPVVIALLVLSSWLRAGTAAQRLWVFLSALLMTATSWAALTFSFVSLEQYVKWVIHFSRASGPRVSIWGQLPAAHTALMAIILALAIAQLARSANRHKNIFAPGIRHAAAIFVIFSAVGTWLEPRQFSQSLSFMLPAGIVLIGRNVLRWPASTEVGFSARFDLVWLWLPAFFLGAVAAFGMPPTGQHSTPTSLRQALFRTTMVSNLHEDIELRNFICRSLSGYSVLIEPTEHHPICLPDASYYWRGSEYLEDGTLQRASIDEPTYNLQADLLKAKPALLGFNAIMWERWGNDFISTHPHYERVGEFYLNSLPVHERSQALE